LRTGASGAGGAARTFGGVWLECSCAVFEIDPFSSVVGSFDSVLVELSIEFWGHRFFVRVRVAVNCIVFLNGLICLLANVMFTYAMGIHITFCLLLAREAHRTILLQYLLLTAGSNAKLPLMMYVCVMGKIHSFRVRIDCNFLTFEKMYS